MSVMLETSLGMVVMDLFCSEAPLACKNFLKLCKIKYYNGCLFYNVQQNFMIQTGDPSATGKEGSSIYGIMYGDQARFFQDEIHPTRKHDQKGLVCMANMGVSNTNSSQFFITMRGDDLNHLDGKHTIFGRVEEGMEVLDDINAQFCDEDGRPFRDIRILHSHILDDPFDDPLQLEVPDVSPVRDRPVEEKVVPRLGAHESIHPDDGKSIEDIEKALREREAKSHAVVLEMIGDLPDAEAAPPENVLFVCKLNPVTTDDDLEIIFTRFGNCKAEIIRDHITGDSLNYAFVEFENIESCEEAYKKMNNVLIDDRRIRVDFSQSVAKEWGKYKLRSAGGQKLKSGRGAPIHSNPVSRVIDINKHPTHKYDYLSKGQHVGSISYDDKNEVRENVKHVKKEIKGNHIDIRRLKGSSRERRDTKRERGGTSREPKDTRRERRDTSRDRNRDGIRNDSREKRHREERYHEYDENLDNSYGRKRREQFSKPSRDRERENNDTSRDRTHRRI